jgi:uncharacterized RDD family membrane protein YckC
LHINICLPQYIFVYMQTVKIQTSQNIDIDYEVAGVGERVLGRLVDIGVSVGLAIVFLILGLVTRWDKVAVIALVIIYAVTFVFYDLLCEVFLNGQSLGKRVMKIKVISIDGGRPSLSQYMLRWLFRIADFSLFGGVVALICVAVSDKSQRVGDMVAGTTLIKTTPRVQMDGLVFRPTAPSSYVPMFSPATELSDHDIVLIHEVISNFNKTGNSVLIYNMATRIKDHLSITPPPDMNDYQFLQTIIKDYNHIASSVED